MCNTSIELDSNNDNDCTMCYGSVPIIFTLARNSMAGNRNLHRGSLLMTIHFRDRPLKKGEKSHYYCDKCGEELHPDFAYTHKCDPFNPWRKDTFLKQKGDFKNDRNRLHQ